jgi:hypothetical protein
MRSLPTASPRTTLVLFAIVLIAGYALFEASAIVQGPHISIAQPKKSAQEEALVTVSGSTKNVTWIALLGKPIHVNEEGSFREELLVPIGYSILTIEAKDRFGRSVTETIEIVRNDPLYTENVLTTASTSPTTPS